MEIAVDLKVNDNGTLKKQSIAHAPTLPSVHETSLVDINIYQSRNQERIETNGDSSKIRMQRNLEKFEDFEFSKHNQLAEAEVNQ